MAPSNFNQNQPTISGILAQIAQANTARLPNKKKSGASFSRLDIAMVWNKALTIPGQDARLWRQDPCGAYMYYGHYGKTSSRWGWEIDHITPVSKGGHDLYYNLQALHWKNNRSKSDTVGKNYCVLTYKK